MGKPNEIVSDPVTGEAVWIYNNRFEAPLLVSFIPVIGDVLDVAETLQALEKGRELFVFFDIRNVVQRYEFRDME